LILLTLPETSQNVQEDPRIDSWISNFFLMVAGRLDSESGVMTMRLTIQRRRRKTTIWLEIGDVVLTVEFPKELGNYRNLTLANSK